MACEELRPYLGRELGWPLNELGRIRLHKGDVAGAEEALLASHRAGWDPQPGLALARLAQGDVTAALASIRDALERPLRVPSKERPPNTDLQRAPLLEAQVEIEIAAGDIGRARSAADELAVVAGRFENKPLAAAAALARGRVRLADGDAAGAGAVVVRRGATLERGRRPVRGGARPHEPRGGPRRPRQRAPSRAGTAGGSLDPRRDRRRSAASSPGAPDPPAESPDVFRREGDYWSVVFDGQTVRVRDLKGMHYLARLLAEPGRELHVLDLVAAETGRETPSDRRPDDLPVTTSGDAGELLDAQAKEAYRRRLAEIDEDIAEARAVGDVERAAQADAERDFLVQELARAFGLGGRGRRAASASERARAGVTRAIRQAMARLAEHHPRLGEHLGRTVRTGTYCAYAPDPRAGAGWNLPP